MKLRFSARAFNDIAAIRDYLMPRNPIAAENLRRTIANDFELLERFPHAGRVTDIPDVRVLPMVRYPYLIYHSIIADEIVVVHVRHSSRDAPTGTDF